MDTKPTNERKKKMLQKLKEAITKMLLPSSKTLAGLAADAITGGVNSAGETTRDRIAKVASIGEAASKVTNELTAMLADGRIDVAERDRIAAMLEPLFAKVLETL